jgi:hypothetical protein
MMALSASIFCYYTFWVIATVRGACRVAAALRETLTTRNHSPSRQPFYEKNHFVLSFFPRRELAVQIPLVLLVVGLGVLGLFISVTMIRMAAKKKQKKA